MPSTLGSKLLRSEIKERNLTYAQVASELIAQGCKVLRCSVWQWATGKTKPSLKNAFGISKWSEGRIYPESWGESNE